MPTDVPRLRRWLLAGEWRAHPLRTLIAIGAIALGVAMGFAIHLINAAAFNEFSAAARSLSGQSDVQVRGVQPFMDEALYPLLARHADVAQAAPLLELDAPIAGQQAPLKIIGIDVFRAAHITPDLIGAAEADRRLDTLADDAIFLSAAAMQWLQMQAGETLTLQSGTQAVALRVAGGLPGARAGQRIAVMDIGAMQWRFDRLGKLSRVELKLKDGVNLTAFIASLGRQLDGQALVAPTAAQETRTANLSRAYRVNLNVLALVALFTGAFLVFSTQALAVIRRRSQFALLRVLGLTRKQLLRQILFEGGLLGVAGSLLGVAGGYAMAAGVLHFFGGDLGGGYFPGVQPTVQFAPMAALGFLLLGIAVAVLGSASPAWEAARAQAALALKSGSEDAALAKLAAPWPALLCLGTGALLAQLPPLFGLPVFGYLAVALLLIGAIALMPRVAAIVFTLIFAAVTKRQAGAIATISLGRLANAPNQASIALGGVLASFSLMVAMAIMVSSFRLSVDDWLLQVLPADLYVQAAPSGNTVTWNPDQQQMIAAVPGIARADFLRLSQLALDATRPPVSLIARPIDAADPGKTLPLVGDALPLADLPQNVLPIWGSEAMVDLYDYRVGRRILLPIQGVMHDAIVAGVWRDYVRQFGAIQMQLSDYRRITNDWAASDAALWLQPGANAAEVSAALRTLPFSATMEIAEPGDIRAISLNIFDRSFAVTYLLQAVAIVIGLFGVAATFSAQTLARAREFGMLRHIGVTRRQILGILAIEGSLLTGIGIAAGFLLGFCISLILVFVVNPQSFHWTMQLHLPWPLLFAVAGVLLAMSAATAVLSGRYAVSGDAVRAVREDW